MNVIFYAIDWTRLRRLHRPIVIDPPGKESYSVRSKNCYATSTRQIPPGGQTRTPPLLSYHHVTLPALWRAWEMRATATASKRRWKSALHNALFPPSHHRRIAECPEINPLT